ncbi:VanZ family protein [Cumulibacter manganitolerans]|uniref:VanZ family protein n=1 Tax=Cumulibacter manganitolerans TaxID=1884992 RepID=UPI001885BB3E|nr:VanZ family protein [Cumulibacter manganitolerans]
MGLIGYGVVVVAVLMLPVSYGGIVNWLTVRLQGITGWAAIRSGWVEFAANILMFVPLGCLLSLLARRRWHGTVLALALSVAAEIAQIVIPSRQPSLRDVLGNFSGAAVGAVLAWLLVAWARRRDRRADPGTSLASEAA